MPPPRHFLKKVTQKGPENPTILSFRAAARNLIFQDSSSLALLEMTMTEASGINTYIVEFLGSIPPGRAPGTEPINNFKGTEALNLYNIEL